MGVHLSSCASYGNMLRQITRSSADEAAIFAVLLRTWANVALDGLGGFIVIEGLCVSETRGATCPRRSLADCLVVRSIDPDFKENDEGFEHYIYRLKSTIDKDKINIISSHLATYSMSPLMIPWLR